MKLENDIAIQTKGVVKKFKDYVAVNGIDINIHKGEVYSILGPNGAGKTTFIKMLSTLIKPDSGSATVYGYDVVEDANTVRKLIGLTGQYATVDEDLTAYENLMIFSKLSGLNKKESIKRTEELLEEFSLTESANKPLKNFSGGMRRRLDLAISLISRPALIFLDEPTTGLDPRTRGKMWDTIRALVDYGSTILLTTQYLEEADKLSNRIAIIDKGQLVAEGTPNELKSKIGGSSLEITFTDLSKVEKAVNIIFNITKEKALFDKANSNVISIPISDYNSITNILNVLNDKGIIIDQFSVKKPSLDEVFLKLTGNKKS